MFCVCVSQETGPDADTCAVCIELYKPGDVLSILTCKYVYIICYQLCFHHHSQCSCLSSCIVGVHSCLCVFCSHLFHKSCIEPWLLEHRTCPMCKCDILKALGVEVSLTNSQIPNNMVYVCKAQRY